MNPYDNPALRAIADQINAEFDSKDYPVIGETWAYKGEDVTITGGYYRDPVYNRVSNFWYFRYANGRTGGDYDNDRTKFHRRHVDD